MKPDKPKRPYKRKTANDLSFKEFLQAREQALLKRVELLEREMSKVNTELAGVRDAKEGIK